MRGADFGRARDGRGGEQRAEDFGQRRVGAGDDGGGHLPQGGVPFRFEQARHAHAADAGDAPQVVARHVDNHQVLGAVFGAAGEAFRVLQVVGAGQPARGGALHRARRDALAVQREEQLGREGGNRVRACVDVRRVGHGLTLVQLPEQRQQVAAEGRAQPKGVVHLVDLASRDCLVDGAQGACVLAAGEGGAPAPPPAILWFPLGLKVIPPSLRFPRARGTAQVWFPLRAGGTLRRGSHLIVRIALSTRSEDGFAR
jgi:hypothetical protein